MTGGQTNERKWSRLQSPHCHKLVIKDSLAGRPIGRSLRNRSSAPGFALSSAPRLEDTGKLC